MKKFNKKILAKKKLNMIVYRNIIVIFNVIQKIVSLNVTI